MESNPPSQAIFPSPAEAAAQGQPSKTFRILLVDDDEILRELVCDALTSNGYDVVCAEDGEAGWDSLSKLEFDLLITDHNMPRLSGFDLISRMKDRDFHIPIIMISGYIPFMFPEATQAIPFCEVMAKPFALEELLQRVGSSLKLMEA